MTQNLQISQQVTLGFVPATRVTRKQPHSPSPTSVSDWRETLLLTNMARLSISTDFIVCTDEGSVLHSNNTRTSEFVLVSDQIQCSSPLSPNERALFQKRASRMSKEEQPTTSSTDAFVLISPGEIVSSAPLSPTDRKLMFRRSSHTSPRLSATPAEFPSDLWRELPAPLDD